MGDYKINALAGWFGGKRTMAPRIVAELGPHHSFWDLFTGSMAVLLAKPVSRNETVNDLHGDLINLARCVRDPDLGPRLYRRLRRTLFSQVELAEAVGFLDATELPDPDFSPDIVRAFAYFVASWQGMNGFGGTAKQSRTFARRFTSSGGDPATRWVNAVDSIPGWRKRLRGVTIVSTDGIALARKIEDRPGCAIYADPPYLVKGAKYLHDFTAQHHIDLAAALCRFRETRVVVSYYDHPDLASLYPGWRVEAIGASKGLVNQGKRDGSGATVAPEVLLCNQPPILLKERA